VDPAEAGDGGFEEVPNGSITHLVPMDGGFVFFKLPFLLLKSRIHSPLQLKRGAFLIFYKFQGLGSKWNKSS
jgi:hypothetical protein